MTKMSFFAAAVGVAVALGGFAAPEPLELPQGLGQPRTADYPAMQERLAVGWNTWFNGSMTTHVLLPEGLAINFGLAKWDSTGYHDHFLKYSENARRSDWIRPSLRADDGAYTSAVVGFSGFDVRLETATDGDDFIALVTPTNKMGHMVVVKAGMAFGKDGLVGKSGSQLAAHVGDRLITVSTTSKTDPAPYLPMTEPRLCVRLDHGPIGFYTGRTRTLAEIRALIDARRAEQEKRVASYGDKAEAFQAMQTILAWNTIYNFRDRRVITPVSRVWNIRWAGWVLFDWDTYFASYMLSLFNRDLAYANAVEITKAITHDGFIPNYKCANRYTDDRSQPPVGSRVVWELYERYHDKWLLEETYDELLTWNRWWAKNRNFEGYLAWGSFRWWKGKVAANNLFEAKLESGLDNSPMFDDVPMNKELGIMMQADVGLMSLYVMDCKALARIARTLDRDDDEKELLARARTYGERLETMWCEEKGIYLNRRLDTGAWNEVLTPCNFYPLLAGTCDKARAERMMKEHYFNPDEFHGDYVLPSSARNCRGFTDNSYWRGRVWAPLNLLVYLGMRDYRLDEARVDLVKRSHNLLMINWRKTGGIYENYNSVTGVGGDVGNSDGFYHWGALLSFIGFLEDEAAGSSR